MRIGMNLMRTVMRIGQPGHTLVMNLMRIVRSVVGIGQPGHTEHDGVLQGLCLYSV